MVAKTAEEALSAPDRWDPCYRIYTPFFALRLIWAALRTGSRARRIALLNRCRDYRSLARDPRLLALHRKLNAYLAEEAREWRSYSYGEGYFYQSLPSVGITGLRDTEGRVAAMGLRQRLAGKRVLDIGCNAGFVDLSIADAAQCVVGIDVNPHVIEIARLVARFQGASNLTFLVSPFEEFDLTDRFDSVLSFANHSTYDGNTRQSLQAYFQRCHDVLEPGGSLLFESHTPEHEGKQLEAVCSLIGNQFEIQERHVLDHGGYLDRNRTFVVARRLN